MQPSSSKSRFQTDPAQQERANADVVEAIDRANHIEKTHQTGEIRGEINESQDEKITRETLKVISIFDEQAAAVEIQDQPSIESHMKQLGEMSDLIRNFQDEELRNAQ